jgi:predicted transcriptional regulator
LFSPTNHFGGETVTDPVAQASAAVPELALRQRVYLLDQVARGPSAGLAQGDANGKIPAAVKRELMLDSSVCNRLRSEMLVEGLLHCEKTKRKQLFQLTDGGRAYLEEHRAALLSVTPGPRGKVNPPKSDEVRQYRTTFLLFQLFRTDRHTLTQAAANRFDTLAKKLELNAATAWVLRHELNQQGLLAITPTGRSETYTLTPEGRLKLGTLAFAPEFDSKLRGLLLNDLLEAARDAARDFRGTERKPEVPAEKAVPDAAQLQQAILATFAELSREQHGATGLVPIHEVRATIRKNLGEQAARHEVFDRVVQDLRQAGRLRLVPITDATQASPEALSSSLPGLGETLFYMEAAREPVAHGSSV